ncbi:energy transducer TonB, partial [Flavobacteriaceae bacterium]|nr:energy transducer TonB [Flavobacteriaceae bacterium]
MINYIIQVMLFQLLFLIVYDFVLSKETFFTKNRWYLLMSAIMSFCIPFIQIPSFQKVVSNGVRILLPEIVLSPQNMIEKTEVYQNFNGGLIIFWLGFLFFLVLFSFKVYKLSSLIIKNFIEKKDSYTLITLPNSKKAFSFFNYIFLGADINELEKEKIISHELIHCKQKHSLDLLFFESLKILMWFNPLLYIYQKRIATVHEYISDAIILKSADKKLYMNTLVNQLFDVENISFVNQFYKHSQLKKRIMMITKEKSNKMKQIKYLLLVPILASMLFYTACSNTENNVLEKRTITKQQIQTKNEIIEKEVIPFTMIDKVPTFPGCPENDKSCFNKKMQQHFQKEFDAELPNSLKLSPGKKRIIMLFKINKEGAIVGIKTKAPHPALQEEAVRIIKLLPIMKPG